MLSGRLRHWKISFFHLFLSISADTLAWCCPHFHFRWIQFLKKLYHISRYPPHANFASKHVNFVLCPPEYPGKPPRLFSLFIYFPYLFFFFPLLPFSSAWYISQFIPKALRMPHPAHPIPAFCHQPAHFPEASYNMLYFQAGNY